MDQSGNLDLFSLSAEQKALFEALLEDEGIELVEQTIPIRPNLDERPLSSTQERLWFMQQLAPESAFYNTVELLRLKGHIYVHLLEMSLRMILSRHEILRTSFRVVNSVPQSVVLPQADIVTQIIDLQNVPVELREEQALQLANQETEVPFDLTQGPLLRSLLIKIDEQEHIAVLSAHHIVCDGWSWGILTEELVITYNNLLQGRPTQLSDLPIQYADYAYWQQQKLQGIEQERLINYWQQQLVDSPLTMNLQTDFSRPTKQTFNGDRIAFDVSRKLTDALNVLCQEEGVTPFIGQLTIYKALLYYFAKQKDILVGFSTWGRSMPCLEGLIGCFMNTLVLRTIVYGHLSFRELLQQIKTTMLEAMAHQDLPFERLVEALQPTRDVNQNQLLQVMVSSVMINGLSVPSPQGVSVHSIDGNTKTAICDLELYICEKPEGIHGYFEYNVDLFERKTIEHLIDYYQRLLGEAVTYPDRKIEQSILLTKDECQSLLELSRRKQVADNHVYNLVDDLRRHAQEMPNAIAIMSQGQTVTYDDLYQRVIQVAAFIQKKQASLDTPIGLYIPISIDCLVGFLGILMAGRTCLLLDLSYPNRQIEQMLQETQPAILVTRSDSTCESILEFAGTKLLVDEMKSGSASDVVMMNWAIQKEKAAYVAYTKDALGHLYSVQVSYEGLFCDVINIAQQCKIAEADHILHLSSYCITRVIKSLCLPLFSKGTLVLIEDQDQLQEEAFVKKVVEQPIVGMICHAPSHFYRHSIWLKNLLQEITSLHWLLIDEDSLTIDRIEAIQAMLSNKTQIINVFGVTEYILYPSYNVIPPEKREDCPNLATGKVFDGYDIFILNDQLNLVPLGMAGELCVSGIGNAQLVGSYPTVMAEHLFPHPYALYPGEKIYRTGILARWRLDATLEVLAPPEGTVQLNDNRFYLTEIEAVLTECPEVQDATVFLYKDREGAEQLVAYIVVATQSIDQTVEQFAQQYLPSYMRPSVIVQVPEIPRTLSQRVDRRVLLSQEKRRREIAAQSNQSQQLTPVQQVLTYLWSDLLGSKEIALYENFFEIGGQSMLAMQAVTQINEIFQVDLPLITIFEKPTIAVLAKLITSVSQAQQIDVDEIAMALLEINQLSHEEIQSRLQEIE